MSIKRAPRPESNFYQLDKRISEDPRLSWAARGLLIFLLGKPDHWEVSTGHLIKQTSESGKKSGRDGVLAILKELITCGYVIRTTHRKEGGEFGGYDYLVSETPKPENPAPVAPDTDSPDTAKPDTANPTQVSIEVTAKTETDNKPCPAAKKTATTREAEDSFALAWQHYPKREGSNPKNHALSAWKARLAEGHTPEVMLTGLRRYLSYCQTKGNVGTGFVMQAKRFFGPSLEFLNDWEVSANQGGGSGMVDPDDTSWIHGDWGY